MNNFVKNLFTGTLAYFITQITRYDMDIKPITSQIQSMNISVDNDNDDDDDDDDDVDDDDDDDDNADHDHDIRSYISNHKYDNNRFHTVSSDIPSNI